MKSRFPCPQASCVKGSFALKERFLEHLCEAPTVNPSRCKGKMRHHALGYFTDNCEKKVCPYKGKRGPEAWAWFSLSRGIYSGFLGCAL